MAQIDEVVDGIYRISTTFSDGFDFQFNQFLIDDERPALIHTGMYSMYDDIRDAVAEVLDPGTLEYVALLHFEADECGGIDRFLEGAPGSALACSAASVQLNLSGWNYRGRVEGHRDGEVIDLGRHKLRFLETPHVHHWDSMMLFEETTKSLFPSDLFIQPGDQPPVVTESLGTEMCAFYREMGIFAHEDPVRRVVDRLDQLDPDWFHGMHGGSLTRAERSRLRARAARGALRVRGQGARARASRLTVDAGQVRCRRCPRSPADSPDHRRSVQAWRGRLRSCSSLPWRHPAKGQRAAHWPVRDYDRLVVSSNVEIVRRSFAAIAAWDVDALLQLYHPEIELLPLTGTRIETGGYIGHEGVRPASRRPMLCGTCSSLGATSFTIWATVCWWSATVVFGGARAGLKTTRPSVG